jgi:hypothetical protein
MKPSDLAEYLDQDPFLEYPLRGSGDPSPPAVPPAGSPRHNYLYVYGELTRLTLRIPTRRAIRAGRGMILVFHA